MQRDQIGAGEQGLHIVHFLYLTRQAPGGINRQRWIIPEHLHAHLQGKVSNH
jgi:hypothetical protein